MNIRGEKITLRAVEKTDLDLFHKWANDPDLWSMLGGWHFPSSSDYQLKWFEALQNDSCRQVFAIDTTDLGVIGTSNIIDIDWKNNHAFHGMMLGDKDIRGKGYGIDTVLTTMKYAFEELHFERLDGSIIEYNTTSYNFYCNKLGWKEEGRQRNWYWRCNRYWDKIMVGITRADYQNLMEGAL
jgi:RimJ/RimL family protein N-acetyltransferase